MKSAIWLSYDLSVRGDYEGLYTWLDDHGAVECGDSVAFLRYEHTGPLIEALIDSLKSAVTISRQTRIYVVYHDPAEGKTRGRFIFGRRKAAPWSGYAPSQDEVLADTEES